MSEEIQKFISELGKVFEGAFKLGLLERVKPEEVEKFRQDFIGSLKLEDGYIDILQMGPEKWGKIGTYIDDQNIKEKYLKMVYVIGLEAGRYYGQAHKDMELIKYYLGEGSLEAGVWQNADLIFVERGTLYVVDLKLSNTSYWIREYFERSSRTNLAELPYLPAINSGVPLNVSVGELSFVNFVEKLLSIKEVLLDPHVEIKGIELKGFVQVLSYAVDYICDESTSKGFREVCLELIYPIAESYRARFYLKEEDIVRLKSYREEVRSLYESLSKRESSLSELSSAQESSVRRRRIMKELERSIRDLEQELMKEEEKCIEVQPAPISECRDDVKKCLDEFLKKEEAACAIGLLHSAGSGKTSRVREAILNREGRHIVIYMASRIILLEREKGKLESMKRDDIKVIYRRERKSNGCYYEHTGEGYKTKSDNKQLGKLGMAVEEISQSAKELKYKIIWALVTTQSLVEHEWGTTAEHLQKLLDYPIVKNYEFHIIVDEFFGYRNGLYVIDALLSFACKVKDRGGKIRLYFLDASGYSSELFKRVLEEYKEYGAVPDSLVLCDYKEKTEFVYRNIPVEVYAKHGYPSSKLFIYKKFLRTEEEKRLIDSIVDYVLKTFNHNSSTAFIYVQDKELIVMLSRRLNEKGLSTTIITASSRKSQEEINKGSSHIILGTSSVSRGVDLSRHHRPVDYIYIIVTDWGIEQNLVELIQAISRARGDENTEGRPKYLHLLFPILKAEDFVLDNLKSLMGLEDIDLIEKYYTLEMLKQKRELAKVTSSIVKNFIRKPTGRVIVPLPAQHAAVYKHNRISDLESIMTFLEDVYTMECSRNLENAKYIREIREELLNSITLSAYFKKKSLHNQLYNYYHPYILVKEGKLKLEFDNKGRERVRSLLEKVKDLLKAHNEEKLKDIENFLDEMARKEYYCINYLLPVYSKIFVEHVLEEGMVAKFKLRSRIGRGSAYALGSGLDLIVRCREAKSASREYAVIPLAEEYPYEEVLSGRFAKFPIEIISKLQEE